MFQLIILWCVCQLGLHLAFGCFHFIFNVCIVWSHEISPFWGSFVYFSVQKEPEARQSAQQLMVSIILVYFTSLLSTLNKSSRMVLSDILNLMVFYCCETQTHPFITMYDDLDVDLSCYFTSVGSPLATL